jgi:hypothetical protein
MRRENSPLSTRSGEFKEIVSQKENEWGILPGLRKNKTQIVIFGYLPKIIHSAHSKNVLYYEKIMKN